MSRIGKLPVNLPKGVTVSISDTNLVSVKGPLGELTQEVNKELKVEVVGTKLYYRDHQNLKVINHCMVFTAHCSIIW